MRTSWLRVSEGRERAWHSQGRLGGTDVMGEGDEPNILVLRNSSSVASSY